MLQQQIFLVPVSSVWVSTRQHLLFLSNIFNAHHTHHQLDQGRSQTFCHARALDEQATLPYCTHTHAHLHMDIDITFKKYVVHLLTI